MGHVIIVACYVRFRPIAVIQNQGSEVTSLNLMLSAVDKGTNFKLFRN